MKHTTARTLSLLLVFLLVFPMLFACAGTQADPDDTTSPVSSDPDTTAAQPVSEPVSLRVLALKGPTGMGMAPLMQNAEEKTAKNDYTFEILSSPDDMTAEILRGDYDIAALPTNLASVLYAKTNGDLAVIAVNTLGTLYVLENGNTVSSLSDLAGKTVYATGKGAVPEYVLSYLLEQNGITCETVWLSEHAELAAQMVAGDVTLGILPEPNVTSVLLSNDQVRKAVDLTEEWDKVSDTPLVMGCLVAKRSLFADHDKLAALDRFLEEYKASVDLVNASPDEAASMIVKFGIVPKEPMAKAAIPGSHMVALTDKDMKTSLSAFLAVLFESNPKSVGGALPQDDFYYTNGDGFWSER